MNKEVVRCNLCEHDEFIAVFIDPKTGFGHGFCNNCGLIYVNPRMNSASREEFYNTYSQKYPESFLLDKNNPYRQIAKKRADFFVSFLKEYDFHPKSLLEVGCSYGFFLKELERCGLNIDLNGVEPSRTESDFALNIMGMQNVCRGVIEDVDPSSNKFDIIALFHVLEHVGDPASVLRSLHELLNPDGLLWIEVPDAEYLSGDLIEFQHFISCQHLYEFSQITMKQILEQTGFEEIILKSEPLGFFLQSNQRAIFRKSNNIRESVDGDPNSHSILSEFHARINKLKTGIEAWLDEQIQNKRDVLIYGGGFHTMGLVGLIDLDRFPIKAILDDDHVKQGKQIEGIPIMSPSIIDNMEPGSILISTLVSEEPLFERLKPLAHKGWHIKTVYKEMQ